MTLIVESPVVRCDARAPCRLGLLDVLSYDQWYEEAASFDELYERIAMTSVTSRIVAER